jgi:hypothetical protein
MTVVDSVGDVFVMDDLQSSWLEVSPQHWEIRLDCLLDVNRRLAATVTTDLPVRT